MGRANAQARQRARKEREKKKARGGGVVHAGQRATLNGKPVVADGKGNWVTAKGWTKPGGTKAGTYTKGEERKPASKGPREGQKRVSNGKNQTYRGGKWVTTSSAGAGARRQQAAATKIEKDRKAKTDSKPKTDPPTTPTKPTKPTPTKPTKTTTKSTTKSNQPANAGAGNGAPRPSSVKTESPKKPHIKSSRLRDALKSVKKFTPKKKKK